MRNHVITNINAPAWNQTTITTKYGKLTESVTCNLQIHLQILVFHFYN